MVQYLKNLIFAASLASVLLRAEFAFAQHTPNDISVSVAFGGQSSLITEPNNTHFYRDPFIGRIQAQLVSNGVQSLSAFIETATETETRTGIWAWQPSPPFDATISENLHMTVLGLETIRTLISESGLRFGVGIGVGYGFGGAWVTTIDNATQTSTHSDSFNSWTGLYVTGLLRLRYSVYTKGSWDIGIILTGRYWGYPTIGPLSSPVDNYNGPDLRSLHELGYLAGVSVGF
jgi:hypothetical protein